MFFARDDRPADRALLFFVFLSLLVGGAAAFFTEPSIAGWYAGLNKPSFNPPNWVFAPVWTTLYVLMGVAASRVWKITGFGTAIIFWLLQLAFNFCWSALFFWRHRIGLALADLVALWLVLAVTLILFWRRDRVAGWLLAPYLAWVSFAFALNLAIWQLNPA